ncbi:IS66 family transposase [Noviherbaspirillum galbum]|uniref:IS66 family transposase n=1 Tax=Noviherbaspirillum galbum TaxID=2709383 RepID=A0A6B3SZ07_9BURK|nr:IS66 family transposase [Noviherbaspirillum galbum]NEX63509.1 IS66 family transposase [Noviherbaspirillum galbum]
MTSTTDLAHLDAEALRALAARLMAEMQVKQTLIDKLTHEMAVLKRIKFAASSEAYTGEQQRLLFETLDTDIEALTAEIEQLAPAKPADDQNEKRQPRRAALPASLPRKDVHHEPHATTCHCGCQLQRIGEDVAEKLDYQPGVFTVERHVRGKWVCRQCETLVQAPVPPQIIDKGIPTAALLAQVLVAKYLDHLPLYRQSGIYGRSGFAIPDTTLAQWVGVCGVRLQPLVDALIEHLLAESVLHADETPVAMLKPGLGKTHRAYLWSYCSTSINTMKAVVFDFAESRAGRHAGEFLGNWRGTLVCDDFAGYKALFREGIVEAGCMAHARRKFHELYANHKSQIAEEALKLFGVLYDVERQVQGLDIKARQMLRHKLGKPAADTLHAWLLAQRQRVPEGSATARAIHYSLERWGALTRYLEDGAVPIDNNWVENQIRPIALGRKNWLFAGSLRAGQRAAAVMSLLHSARLNGHDAHAYMKDVLERLPTLPASRIDELLPHRWTPA